MSRLRALGGRVFRPLHLEDPTQVSLATGSVLSTTGLLAQGFLRFATAFLVGHIAGRDAAGAALADDERQRGVEVRRPCPGGR